MEKRLVIEAAASRTRALALAGIAHGVVVSTAWLTARPLWPATRVEMRGWRRRAHLGAPSQLPAAPAVWLATTFGEGGRNERQSANDTERPSPPIVSLG